MSEKVRFQCDGAVKLVDSGDGGVICLKLTDGDGNDLRGVVALRYEADARGKMIPELTLVLESTFCAFELDRKGVTIEADVDEIRAQLREIVSERVFRARINPVARSRKPEDAQEQDAQEPS
jgi:hypothetical protein